MVFYKLIITCDSSHHFYYSEEKKSSNYYYITNIYVLILKLLQGVRVTEAITIRICVEGEIANIGCPISNPTEKKLNISITARSNGLIFSPRIEACVHFKSMRTRLMRTIAKYNYGVQ